MGLSYTCAGLALFSLISAQAQTATTKQTSAASASFAYVSDDGCVQNEVIVFATKTTVTAAATPNPTSAVTYSRYRYDDCQDADLGTDVGSSQRSLFSGDLNKAMLNATINGTTASGGTVTISIVLVWEGKGSPTRLPGHPANQRAGGPKVIRGESLSRNATLVSGTIDGQDVSHGVVSAILHTTQTTTPR